MNNVLKHLYISPLELCNLQCKICYTQKVQHMLHRDEIVEFIKRYQSVQKLEVITFCGGEVFTLKYFPELLNELTRQGIFIQIITNGTVDTLDQLESPNSITMLVSLDGLPTYHDANRGQGNFAKSLAFLKRAQAKGFHTEVFSIVTKENFPFITQFEEYLEKELQQKPPVTYHPRKPMAYLLNHPISNRVGDIEGFSFLNEQELNELSAKHTIFPPPELGCYQISLMSDRKVYGCCEGIRPLGSMDEDISLLIEKLRQRVGEDPQDFSQSYCGCCESHFKCGMKKYVLRETTTFPAKQHSPVKQHSPSDLL